MLQVKTPAIVLDKEPGYKDEGNITIFTKDFGVLRVIASGIYRPGARLSAWTEPPTSIIADITLKERSHGFGRLLTLTLKNYFPHIRASYQNSSWFYFYCFLLKNFLPHGTKSPKTYKLLKEVLKFPDSWESESKRDVNFAYFLVRFLEIEGVCSGFNGCVSCEKQFEENEMAYFSPSVQGLLCEGCSRKIARDKHQNAVACDMSLDYLDLLPQRNNLNPPTGLLRIKPEERMVLETCEKSEGFKAAYTNIFSRSKINDQTLAKVRNFLLIFLAPLL